MPDLQSPAEQGILRRAQGTKERRLSAAITAKRLPPYG